MDHHDWLSLHHVRFADPRSALTETFPGPDTAAFWRFCPNQALTDTGMPSFASDRWGGLALYHTRAQAQAVVDDPTSHLPFLDGAVEHWHALLVPYAHHGAVRWRDTVQQDTAVRVSREKPGGPLVVITSAGFDSRDPDQVPRIVSFLKGIEHVLDFYGAQPGNIRRATFNGGFDTRDGFTCTLWKNDRAMMDSAYRPGSHRSYLDQSRDGSLFDRSSFTRARIVASRGSWDGDPMALADTG